jgi:hypothetical protein
MQFQAAIGVAADLPAGDFAIVSHAHFVGHVGCDRRVL